MRTSKFINLNKNVLLEWIYDDDNLLIENYKVVINTLDDQYNFVNSNETNTITTVTNNTQSTNLILINAESNKWGYMDETQYPFLQISSYLYNIPQRYDIVRIYFPVNYSFDDYIGFLLNLYVLDITEKRKIYLSNFFFDQTDTSRSLDLAAPPFLHDDILWGKYIELQIPSPSVLSKQVSQTTTGGITLVPTPGSINSNLSGPTLAGVNPNSPIFIDFSFLLKKDYLFNKITFLADSVYSTSIPQTPEFEDLSVEIAPSDKGDFFEIVGTYNNNSSDFELFVKQQKALGNYFYVTYKVNTIEQNVITNTVQYFTENNFDHAIWFRPIITFSTTTAAIDVIMSLVNASDSNVIERRATYTLLQDEVAKYSRILTKINVDNAYNVSVYNARSDKLEIKSFGEPKTIVEKVDVPYPVLYDNFKVITKNTSEDIQDEVYYGIGQLQILLYPFDNVIKLNIAKQSKDGSVVPYSLPNYGRITMSFKSATDEVTVDLYNDSGLVDLEKGDVIFKIEQQYMDTITNFYKNGYDQFYIVMRTETNINTILYAGRYVIYNEYNK